MLFAGLLAGFLQFYAIWALVTGSLAGALESFAKIKTGNFINFMWLAMFSAPLLFGCIGVILTMIGIFYKNP